MIFECVSILVFLCKQRIAASILVFQISYAYEKSISIFTQEYILTKKLRAPRSLIINAKNLELSILSKICFALLSLFHVIYQLFHKYTGYFEGKSYFFNVLIYFMIKYICTLFF